MKTETIKNIISELLEKMNVSVDEIEVKDDPAFPKFLIKSKDSRMLIGPRGEHLMALHNVLRRLVSKKIGEERPQFFVDVNNYQESALRSIRDKAVVMAERAKSFKTSIEMEPMSSYERMMVHTLLESTPNIATESKGEGGERRVVIKFVE